MAVYLAVLIAFWDSVSAGEVRKYEFEGSRDYQYYGWGYGSAFLTGSFEVELDFEAGVGTLLSLETQLTEQQGVVVATEFFETGYGGYFYDSYRPPLPGLLQPALLRPISGRGTIYEYIRAEQNDDLSSVAFYIENGFLEPAGEDAWVLFFDGYIRAEDFITSTSSYIIYLKGTEALLSITLPVFDDTPYIRAARATLVPEPTSLVLLSAAMIWAFGRRGCCSAERISP